MIRLSQELEDKIRSLDPVQAQQLESAVRGAMARVDQQSGIAPKEQQECLRQLIGIWKCDTPPSDDDVKQILDDERMAKYG